MQKWFSIEGAALQPFKIQEIPILLAIHQHELCSILLVVPLDRVAQNV